MNMRARKYRWCGLLALAGASLAFAQDAELEEGKKLYEKECLVCHGSNASAATSHGERQLLARALAPQFSETMVDAGSDAKPAGADRLAVAPPFGPNLRGIHGRPAGSVEGFQYSAPFLKSLKGMIWDDGSLDVWMTSTQRWVPGVTMYYTQKNADIRRKIIEYLKANP
jgi:cytochrome c2